LTETEHMEVEAVAAAAVPAAVPVIVDALPYIDHGYDEPGVREAVRKIPH